MKCPSIRRGGVSASPHRRIRLSASLRGRQVPRSAITATMIPHANTDPVHVRKDAYKDAYKDRAMNNSFARENRSLDRRSRELLTDSRNNPNVNHRIRSSRDLRKPSAGWSSNGEINISRKSFRAHTEFRRSGRTHQRERIREVPFEDTARMQIPRSRSTTAGDRQPDRTACLLIK